MMEVLLGWWNRRRHQHQARTIKAWLCPELQRRWWSRGLGCTNLPRIQSVRRCLEQQPFSFSSSSHNQQQGPGDTPGCWEEGRQLSKPGSAASYHKVMDEQQGLLLNGDSGGSLQLVNRDAPACCQAVK